MVSFRLAAVAAALVIVGASAHPTAAPATTTVAPSKYGKYGKYMMPTAAPETYPASCTAPKDRCAGAPGKPYVEYIGCCGNTQCVPAPELGWGRFCLPKPERKYGEAPKCHKLGERCMGAKGYEYVQWLGCCGGASCEADPAMGWGSFCKPGTGYDPAYEASPTEAPYTYGEPTAEPTAEPTQAPYYKYYSEPTAEPTAEPTQAPYYKYYYPKATMAPTMAPTAAPKSYGYNYYGYGKKTTTAPTVDECLATAGDGNAPAEENENPITDTTGTGFVAIFQSIQISSDDPDTCIVSEESVALVDVQAILDEICVAANLAASDGAVTEGRVTCKFISIEEGTPTAGRMSNQDMNAVARQAGGIVEVLYELLATLEDLAAVLASLAESAPAGSAAPVFVAPEGLTPAPATTTVATTTVATTTAATTTAATTTVATTLPVESPEFE